MTTTTMAAQPTVLVAEDETLLLKSLEIKLRKEGYHVVTCADGEAAMNCLHEHKPQVVITDINLPGCNGCELAKAAKAMAEPAYVLVTSGTEDEAEMQRALSCGADLFIKKPFNLNRVVEELKQLRSVVAG